MNFVFLMDPLDTVVLEKDTSFMLMIGAHRKGHRVYFLPAEGITLIDGRVHLHVTEVIPQYIAGQEFIIKDRLTLTEKNADAVFIRKDPPFDYKYLMHTWLLERLPETVPVINSPAGIRTANEKIWATQFTDFVPPTMVGVEPLDLFDFLNKHGDIVAKPTDGHGGKSVFRIQKDDRNARVILETLTHHFSRDIILQKFIPEAERGDKRILLLNGDPLGAVLRLHAGNDHRNNFFSGGTAHSVGITDRDMAIIAGIKPALQKAGLTFVGIDILGGYLIEINVTSPTCLQEMNHFYGVQLEDKVISFVENLIKKRLETRDGRPEQGP